MQRISQYNGQVINASPYAIPPGALQECVNFETRTPGQLESRRGLRKLPSEDGVADECVITGMHHIPGAIGVSDKALIFDSCGNATIWPDEWPNVPKYNLLYGQDMDTADEKVGILLTETEVPIGI